MRSSEITFNGRVLLVDVIADLSIPHCQSHLPIRFANRVAAAVDNKNLKRQKNVQSQNIKSTGDFYLIGNCVAT